VEVFTEPPRAWLLERAAAELHWATRHGDFAYRVLTACRAWRYLEDDLLGSKVDGGRWARNRLAAGDETGPEAVALVDAAVAAQLGQAPMPDAGADLAAADRLVAAVHHRFAWATG
jgi:hypothetical protein